MKSFIGPSEIEDLKDALGQFVLYRAVMSKTEPDRELYIAVRDAIYTELFEEPVGKLLMETEQIGLAVFDPEKEVIVKWIP